MSSSQEVLRFNIYGQMAIYFAGNLLATRALALAASSSRFLGSAFVSSELRSLLETVATPSTAARKAFSLILDGLLKPLTFLTNCSAAARISSSVTGGSKLKRVLIFLHTGDTFLPSLSNNRV